MILGLCVTVLGKPCKTFHCSYRKKEYASAQESGSNPLKISALIITMDAHDMYRLGMISKSELKRRQQERARAQFEMMENCDNGNFFPAQFHGMLLHCRSWGLLWRKPMLKESLWSFSIRNAGGIITGVGTAQLSLGLWFCLGIGISAIVLGALTATGFCVDECCCSISAEQDSNPVEVQREGTLGSPATSHQPYWVSELWQQYISTP